MDDGFQYLKLKRDVDILLLDAVNPFGNGHLIPRGTLREPLAGLKRADVILLTRTAKLAPEDIDGFREYLGKYKTAPIGIVKEEHSQLLPLSRWGQKVSPMAASQYLPGKKVAAITGIGNPAQFLSSLETLGAEVGYFKAYPDHYSWKTEEIANLIVTLTEWGFEDLIVTGKDGVKLEVYLEQFEQMGLNCLILSLEYQVDDQEVTAKIMDRLLRKVEANQ
jgi:tetraacyldisaccharide 4'-kinase